MSTPVIGHLLRAADFERVLGTPSRARSPHFAVHYLASLPSRPGRVAGVGAATGSELSTDPCGGERPLVDDAAPHGLWVGTVVPKRHARRAVTRTLLKRQIHRAVRDQCDASGADGVPAGLWVVRLRAGFDRSLFPSAASDALRRSAAEELGTVMAHAVRRARG